MADIENLAIGPATVTLGGQDIGHVKEAITIKLDRSIADLKVAKYGETPVERAVTGVTGEIEMELAETTAGNIQRAIPEGQLDGNVLSVSGQAGIKLRQFAQELVITALDGSMIVTAHLATVTSPLEFSFHPSEQRVFPVTFSLFPDETQEAGSDLLTIEVAGS